MIKIDPKSLKIRVFFGDISGEAFFFVHETGGHWQKLIASACTNMCMTRTRGSEQDMLQYFSAQGFVRIDRQIL